MHERQTVRLSAASIFDSRPKGPDKPPDPPACVRGYSHIGMLCHCPALSCSGFAIRQNASARSHRKVYRRCQFRNCLSRGSRWRGRQRSLSTSGDASDGHRAGSGRNARAVGYDLWTGFLYRSCFRRGSLRERGDNRKTGNRLQFGILQCGYAPQECPNSRRR
jgi:hypothetical protein